jgi:hypothetical protein
MSPKLFTTHLQSTLTTAFQLLFTVFGNKEPAERKINLWCNTVPKHKIFHISGPGEKRKKVNLIDDFGRDEDHVDETGDELPE